MSTNDPKSQTEVATDLTVLEVPPHPQFPTIHENTDHTLQRESPTERNTGIDRSV